MGMWTIMEEGRDDYGRGFGTREGESEVEMAYREGCRHGYRKAMEELHGGMGFRGGDGMGERRMTGYPEPMYREIPPYDDMGERRRRRANGQWY